MPFTVYQYHLPFATPLVTSRSSFAQRRGLILEYNSGDRSLFAEAAPLPGFSKESLDDVISTLQQLHAPVQACFEDSFPIKALLALYDEHYIPPSLQFALDTLAYQLAALEKHQPLAHVLFEQSAPQLRVNALGNLLSDDPLEETTQLIKQGFGTIKFKIGRSFDKELKQLKEIRSAFPDVTIRLDANGVWELDDALSRCKQLSQLDIEYCEEPLREPSPKNVEHLYNNTSLPLALDESLTKTDWWPNLLPFTSHIIIKPMLLGSFTTVFETNRLANTHDNETVYTTCLESGIGRVVTATLASGLGSPQTAHGLDTGRLLTKDLYSDLDYISEGNYRLPELQKQLEITPQQLQQLAVIKIQQ